MFEFEQKVLFKHCDPAGIAFFPRYFEMMNDCVEVFFADALHWPFEKLMAEGGVPTSTISTDFKAPSRHGDQLVLSLDITHLGRTSLTYEMTARCGEEVRFVTQARLVHVSTNGRPAPWPDHIRARLQDLRTG